MSDPEKSGRDQAGRWEPGTSGNRDGKPKGARNHATRALEALLGESADAVAKAVIRAAEQGDTAAARLVLERVMPARRDGPVSIDLPAISGPESLLQAGTAVLAAVAAGDITPAEGDSVMALLERQRRLVETADHEARIAELERTTK